MHTLSFKPLRLFAFFWLTMHSYLVPSPCCPLSLVGVVVSVKSEVRETGFRIDIFLFNSLESDDVYYQLYAMTHYRIALLITSSSCSYAHISTQLHP